MIRNEAEYQEASVRLADERKRLAEHRARLKEAGLGEEEIKRVIDPMESFHLQLKEEVESYERLKRGEFEELEKSTDARNFVCDTKGRLGENHADLLLRGGSPREGEARPHSGHGPARHSDRLVQRSRV